MSKINPGLYSSEDHTWMTPPDLVQAILDFEEREYFDIDPCCSEKNIPAATHFLYPEQDGLEVRWQNGERGCSPLVFVNPPYGDKLKLFLKKVFMEAFRGCRVWVLIPARTETQYQHDYGLTKAGFAVFLKGRLKFLKNGVADGTAPFPTMLLYYGPDADEKARRWVADPPIKGTLMRAMR